MFNINVQRETRTIVKAVGVLGWLIIFSVTTYLYVRQGCPHPELEYSSSSCQPYVYNAGLIPASYIPPMNIYKSLTMTGGGLQCYMERFLYSYQSLGLGYAQNFRSEIYCAFNGTTNYTKFAYIDSAPNIASRLLSEVYYGTTDQWNTDLVHNTTMASCYFIVNNSAFTTCTVTFKNGTTASDIPITPGMMKYFDYSPNLETLVNTETEYTCSRCRPQDITFRNFTAYLAGTAVYLNTFTTLFLIVIGWRYVTNLDIIIKKGDGELPLIKST